MKAYPWKTANLIWVNPDSRHAPFALSSWSATRPPVPPPPMRTGPPKACRPFFKAAGSPSTGRHFLAHEV
jgi:hypothetical protein